jgi:hypothetical protein
LKERYERTNSTIEGLAKDARRKPEDYGRGPNLTNDDDSDEEKEPNAEETINGWRTPGGQVIPCVGLKELGEIDYTKCEFPPAENGHPGDGRVYTNSNGKLCMIDRAGRSYLIRADGTRATKDEKKNAARPLGYEIDAWARLPQNEKTRYDEIMI